MHDPRFAGGLHAGTVPPDVIGVVSVRDDIEALLAGLGLDDLVEFRFAEIAAVMWILGKAFHLKFVGLDLDLPDADSFRQLAGLGLFPGRIGGRQRRNGYGTFSEDVVRDGRQERTVDATREGDGQSARLPHGPAQGLVLLINRAITHSCS